MKRNILSVQSAIFLCIALLAASIFLAGTSPALMRCLMERYAPPASTGLPAEQYAPMARMITRYLAHGGDFQLTYMVDGMERIAFNAREQAHMADVHLLFRLCGNVLWVCGGGAILAGWLAFREKMAWRVFRRTLVVVLTTVTILVLAAAIDFDGLFILFHRIAFTNDLWLLNPQTDLLIRLMPIEFFISYAALIGGAWVLMMALLLILATVRLRKTQSINKSSNDKGE